MTMRALEIFSGAGGLAKGLADAGFAHAALVEWNKHACTTLRENFEHIPVHGIDIKNFDFSTLGAVDVVAGGPPCQPFSLGGKHQAHDDSRDMFPHAIRAIEQLSPKAFIFENVKGLLRSSFADYFEYILLRLSYPGLHGGHMDDWRAHLQLLKRVDPMTHAGTRYNVQFKLLNAADFGVPQTRERVFIVGIRNDVNAQWTFPRATHSEDRLLWDMHVSGDYWIKHGLNRHAELAQTHDASRLHAAALTARYGLFEPATLPWQTVRDALENIPPPSTTHGIADHIFRDGARAYPGHTGSELDWPAKTIKAGGHGVPGGENMIRYPDGSLRYFTVFEAKQIQTFPADFKVTGAWGEAMRQIGNAVPVKLATVLGKHLKNTLQVSTETRKEVRKAEPCCTV